MNKLCRRVKDKSFPVIVFHDRHNHQEINNSIQVEIHRIQTNEVDRNIVLKMKDVTCRMKFIRLTVNIT